MSGVTAALLQTRGVSHRRACTVLNVARPALGYCSRLAVKDAPAIKRMVEASLQHPRYRYRRIAIFLRRDGHRQKHKAEIAAYSN